MSRVSSNCPRELRKSRTDSSNRPVSNRFIRPGWTEIAVVVGLTVMFAFVAGGLLFTKQLGLSPVMYGLLLR